MKAEELKKKLEEQGMEPKWISSPERTVELIPGGVDKDTLLRVKSLLAGELQKLRGQADTLRSESNRIRHGGGK